MTGAPVGPEVATRKDPPAGVATERRRAELGVERLERMQRIAAALSGRLTDDQVAQVVLRDVAVHVGGVSRALWLTDESAGVLRLVRAEEHPRAAPFADMPIAGDLPGAAVARSGAALFVERREERDRDYPALARLPGSASFAALPLTIRGDRIAGVLALAYDEDHVFDPDERRFLTAVADLAAQALERGRLHVAEARAAEHLATLAGASAALASSLDYAVTLNRVAHLMVGSIADLATVHLFDESGELTRVALAHRDPAAEAALLRRDGPNPVATVSPLLVKVTESAASVLVSQVNAPLVAQLAVDDEHAQVLEQMQLRSGISAPLIGRNGPLGVINFVRLGSSPPYRPEDQVLAEELARRAAMAIDNAVLHKRQGEVARLLQRSLLPPTLPEIGGLRLAAIYEPAGQGTEVGGDFYDIFPLSGPRWGLMIGDVCGTGPAAAAITAQVRHTARAVANMGVPPDEVVAHVNEALVATIGDERFCTMVFGTLTMSPSRGAELELVGAGHPPPLLVRADGRLELVACAGPLLGVFPETRFNSVRVALSPGESLLLYTDGVPEARAAAAGRDGRRGYFGLERVGASTAATAGKPAADLVNGIKTALHVYTGGRLDDDVAILAVQVTP